jgi:hypothetical protein
VSITGVANLTVLTYAKPEGCHAVQALGIVVVLLGSLKVSQTKHAPVLEILLWFANFDRQQAVVVVLLLEVSNFLQKREVGISLTTPPRGSPKQLAFFNY